MNAGRVYSMLLCLYPKPFRDEYGVEMLDAFQEMHRRRTRPAAAFWTFVVLDTARAAGRERLDSMRWLATAMFGLLVTVVTAHAATFTYRYFYHPYFEGTSISALPYGVALGLVLGVSVLAAQLAMFPAAERRAGRWALTSAVTLPIAVLFCSTAIQQALDGLKPAVIVRQPVGLDLLVVGLARPFSWHDVATQFAAMAVAAILVSTVMLRPLERRHAY